ncbi:signal peptidase I [Sphingomonas baiyangensis]|uniref:Signal peptidase I n=1 Tax=Sphingomonas baiyangensis TaxID=2572576 RepID=A0A4U1L0W1_9SPHN|nr:signal peptidase I [Sphingomonas baiyangensis]TKD50399.1 signal peptidase I [Sphingomonas baiyangensis]
MPADDLTLRNLNAEPAEKKKGTDWWAEARGILWLVLAVIGVHSLIAKPFYIPSESMLPALRVGDRLIVSKFPYGWSFISPTFHILPPMKGRLMGSMPERGDIVILVPDGQRVDWIKRVIGLPGDTVAMDDGQLVLNGTPVPKVSLGERLIPVDANTRCDAMHYPGMFVRAADGSAACRVPTFRETLPGGASYDVLDVRYSAGIDDFGPVRVPKGHVFLMGDNRDNSADSRMPASMGGLGGPVAWENIGGRAEFITFSLDGTATLNPVTWFGSLRGERTGMSLHPERP